jgi:hypothetical protein
MRPARHGRRHVKVNVRGKFRKAKRGDRSSGRKYGKIHSPTNKIDVSPTYFRHERLNYKEQSIRVIEILPDLSPDGFIQCEVRHATTADKYTCLSYTWGVSIRYPFAIRINRRLFAVRRNLWDFLQVARTKYHSKPLWIGAICIDQENNEEKNHQVQQMGQIFSKAVEVLAWLGNHPKTAEFLSLIGQIPGPRLSWESFKDEGNTVPDDLLYFFERNYYWRRAWITQELVLARRVAILSGREELNFNMLPRKMRIHGTLQGAELKGKSLVHLLRLLDDRDCKCKRDQIFSLLALCNENIQVDYGIPDEHVLWQTLKSCQESLCFCTVSLVANALEIKLLDIAIQISTKTQLQRSYIARQYCVRCREMLPYAWWINSGYLFCLSSVCEGIRRHLFFHAYRHQQGTFYPYIDDEHGHYLEDYESMGIFVGSGVRLAERFESDSCNLQFVDLRTLVSVCRGDYGFKSLPHRKRLWFDDG